MAATGLTLNALAARIGCSAGRPLDARKDPVNQWLTRPETRWKTFSSLPAGEQLKIASERQAGLLITTPSVKLLSQILMGSWALNAGSLRDVPGFPPQTVLEKARASRLIDKDGHLLARAVFPESITCSRLEMRLTPDGYAGLIRAIARSQTWRPEKEFAASVMKDPPQGTPFPISIHRRFTEDQKARLIDAASNKMGGDIFEGPITCILPNVMTVNSAVRARSTTPSPGDNGKDIEWLRKIDPVNMFDLPLVHLAMGLLENNRNSALEFRDYVSVNGLLCGRFSQIFPVVADWA